MVITISAKHKDVINVSILDKFDIIRAFIQADFSWYERKLSAKCGPRGEPIETPSHCLYNLLSKMKHVSSIANVSSSRNTC